MAVSLESRIREGHFQQIIVLSGAGVSTNAGIPDYRSKDGLFAQFRHISGVKTPENIFTRDFAKTSEANPIYEKIISKINTAEPTPSHFFCYWLYQKGWLRRVYTQNIDGLYQKTNLPDEMIVEFHGSFHKNNVVMYEDEIPSPIIERVMDDFVLNPTPIDLIIVMGTSLQVAPFCAIPNLVPRKCVRILVDLYPQGAMKNPWTKKKIDYDYMYGLYGNPDPPLDSVITFKKDRIKRRVSLRPQWRDRKKWQSQYIIESDSDIWVLSIMASN